MPLVGGGIRLSWFGGIVWRFWVVRSSFPFLWTRYLRNAMEEFLKIWQKHPLGQRSRSLSPHIILMNHILRNNLREFLQICHKCLLQLKDELIRFWWAKVKITVPSRNVRENNIAGIPWGNFFKSCTKFHLDLMMNWLESSSQRSRSLWPHMWWNSLSILCKKSLEVKTACFSLGIILWNHTCQYSDNCNTLTVIPFIKFLQSLHYIYYLDRQGM